MSQPVEAACLAIADVLAAVTGIRQVHDYAPDNLNAYPAIIIYPQQGVYDVAPMGVRKALHNIAVELFIPSQVSSGSRQMEELTKLIDPIAAALTGEISDSGTRFNNTINTFGTLTYQFISANYAGTPVRGYKFIMDNVKILVTR